MKNTPNIEGFPYSRRPGSDDNDSVDAQKFQQMMKDRHKIDASEETEKREGRQRPRSQEEEEDLEQTEDSKLETPKADFSEYLKEAPKTKSMFDPSRGKRQLVEESGTSNQESSSPSPIHIRAESRKQGLSEPSGLETSSQTTSSPDAEIIRAPSRQQSPNQKADQTDQTDQANQTDQTDQTNKTDQADQNKKATDTSQSAESDFKKEPQKKAPSTEKSPAKAPDKKGQKQPASKKQDSKKAGIEGAQPPPKKDKTGLAKSEEDQTVDTAKTKKQPKVPPPWAETEHADTLKAEKEAAKGDVLPPPKEEKEKQAAEKVQPPLTPKKEEEKANEVQKKRKEEREAIISVSQKGEGTLGNLHKDQQKERTPLQVEGTAPAAAPDSGQAGPLSPPEAATYAKLPSEVFNLFERLVGVMTIEQHKRGDSTTTVTLNMPGSVFNKCEVELKYFSTAPGSFNLRLAGNPKAVELFSQNISQLAAAFNAGNLAYSVNLQNPILLRESRHLIQRKGGTDKGGQNDDSGDKK